MIDRHSETWRTVEAWALNKTNIAIESLCVKGADATETEFRRGQIDALRQLMTLARAADDPPRPGDGPIIA